MSEPWTCPSCQFEWVVDVRGECLSCGYGSGVREEQAVGAETVVQGTLQSAVRDDPLAPLYPPGTYPPPIETPPVLNGERQARGDPKPQVLFPTPTYLKEEAQRRAYTSQQAFLAAMTAARARIETLEHEVAIQQQQVKEAVAAESEVRASVERWQQVAQQERQDRLAYGNEIGKLKEQVVTLAEANQVLRQEQLIWRQTPSRAAASVSQPKAPGPWQERRVDALEKQLGQMSALLDTIVQRLDHEQVPASKSDPDAYSTFITTDSQAAQIEQEILRSQAQYQRPWRG